MIALTPFGRVAVVLALLVIAVSVVRSVRRASNANAELQKRRMQR